MKTPFLSSPSLIWTNLKSSAAETLAEVLIALIVISVGAGGALTLVVTSMRANTEVKERLMAYNLAREGVEAVRTIRDSNWLRFPSDRTNCWSALPDVTDPATCGAVGFKLGDEPPYIISLNFDNNYRNFAWQIQTVTDFVNEPILYEVDLDLSDGEIIYIHDYAAWCDGRCDTPSPYSRVVDVEEQIGGSLLVTATVSWNSHGQERDISFVDALTNY